MKVWSARAHLVARDDLEHVVGQLLPHRLLLRLDGLDALRHIGRHAGRVGERGERGALWGRHILVHSGASFQMAGSSAILRIRSTTMALCGASALLTAPGSSEGSRASTMLR